MTRPRLLADHDLNEHIVVSVRRQEPAIEFIRLRDLGMDNRSDAEILEYADQSGLLVVSHDVNTMPAEAYARLAAGKTTAGLSMVQQTHPIRSIINNLVLIWAASEAEEWRNLICFLPLG